MSTEEPGQVERPTNCSACDVLLYWGRNLGGPDVDTAYSCDGDGCTNVICWSCLVRGDGYCQVDACQAEAAAVNEWIVATLGPRRLHRRMEATSHEP